MNEEGLFSEFPEVSAKAWKQKIQYGLRGADYNETLVWESPEGIKIKPFYHAEDMEGQPKYSCPLPRHWTIAQEIYAGNAILANKKAQTALKNGTESLVFKIPSDDISLETLLSGIDIGRVPLFFDLQFLSTSYVRKVFNFLKGTPHKLRFQTDIIGHLARTGNWFYNLKEDHRIVGKILSEIDFPSLSVDATRYQNAGANMVQQLAYSLAHANEYLNYFEAKSLQPILFKVAVGSNYFFEIAKLRALRLLWGTLASEYGISSDCHIIAQPTKRNKTLYDYNTNMLRTTTECLSAILGGADTVLNLPYDAVYHKDNKFAERMARNQLLILKNESYFDRGADPAAGSYYIETLTRQLAEKGLELFKSIETGGGFLTQLKNHTLQKKIKESAQREQQRFSAGQEVLVGTNKYQNTNDRMKDELELYPFVKTNARKTLVEPIIERRMAENLEKERLDKEG
ncbi:methylmalonyl-CoA mutase subunit beta [Flavobacteriaceae bacterium F89]|uniref:Methylmalonyl-CoA mutase subunit beta n=1 Tax=Cerina litoralis TaxID=2874477 RepID=A0AAE3JSD1_9FLAO|nr:methylmalonyl-CoA mutase subunit beta [Cerina litoralis]MCG2460457.1 methylmalonyl-CoA mutase subunit beta [Cerina litoralis]